MIVMKLLSEDAVVEIIRLSREPWEMFKTDLVKQPGYHPEMEELIFDGFLAGLVAAHTIISTHEWDWSEDLSRLRN